MVFQQFEKIQIVHLPPYENFWENCFENTVIYVYQLCLNMLQLF